MSDNQPVQVNPHQEDEGTSIVKLQQSSARYELMNNVIGHRNVQINMNPFIELGYKEFYINDIIKFNHEKLKMLTEQEQIEFIFGILAKEKEEKNIRLKKQSSLSLFQFDDDLDYQLEEEKSVFEKIVLPLGMRINKNYQFNLNLNQNQEQSEPDQAEQLEQEEKLQKMEIKKDESSIEIVEINKISKLNANNTSNINNSQDQPQIQQFQLNKINKEECLICLSDIEQSNFKALAPCGHRFCRECLDLFLENCIKNSQVLRVNCPLEGCSEEYTEDIIKENVNDELFTKFKKFKHIKQVSQNPNVRWCPRIGCENYVTGNQFSKKLTCECGQDICFNCGSNYHQGLRCEDALDQNYKLAKKEYSIYPCPKCKSPIQKKSGCNHMTCANCDYQFCWICMGKYTSIHYVLWNFCGCIIPGGQFANVKPFENPTLMKILMAFPRLILIIITLIALAVILPLLLIITSFRFPYLVFVRFKGRHWFYHKRCLKIMLFIFLGIILFPFSLIVEIVPLSCIYFYHFVRNRY